MSEAKANAQRVFPELKSSPNPSCRNALFACPERVIGYLA